MEGAGGAPGYRTVLGDYAVTAETAVPQEDLLVSRIQGEFKLVLVSADPLGLLRPPEGAEVTEFLGLHLV